MHDMRIALDHHGVGHLYRTDFCDPTHVVTREVNQHDMLGTLFGVGQQFCSERCIEFGRCSTFARTG